MHKTAVLAGSTPHFTHFAAQLSKAVRRARAGAP